MVTHSMENILNMHHQYYVPTNPDEPPESPPSRKRSRCLNKEVNYYHPYKLRLVLLFYK